jgi:hypothetical protein
MPDASPVKRKRGKQPHDITDERRHVVGIMIANGNSMAAVGRALQCSQDTLERHYRQQIRHGREDLRASVEMAMVRAALSGNVAAMKAWLAHHYRDWRESLSSTQADATAAPSAEDVPVRFYLPANGRDHPERLEPETIDAENEMEDAATTERRANEAA